MRKVFYICGKAHCFGQFGALYYVEGLVAPPRYPKPVGIVWWFPWNWVVFLLIITKVLDPLRKYRKFME